MTTAEANEKIDRLLHDAERANAGAEYAFRFGDVGPATRLRKKARRLRTEADNVYLDNPGTEWPECEFLPPRRDTPRRRESEA